MKLVSIFKNGKNQAVRIPKDLEFDGVSELEISREGDTIILRPARQNWLSLQNIEHADDDFLIDREESISDEGRF
ncbi:type II toxin-antitoxin system VapB family antitoxin [Marinicellulosiphila megalodicopiae]|uniref:type II toxin-antitoxin system VapB family antitoxin n=1 Tax=Marinicellulosiphila megalodicopiae TaxID=2724896 RepID=UPI003BAEC665